MRLLHRIVRAVGVVVLLASLVGGIYLYRSPSHDFRCDGLKQFQRQREGKDYWCFWRD